MKPTSIQDLDKAVAELAANKDRWTKLGIDERLALLRACMDATLATAPSWVEAACEAKGLSKDSPTAAEEWLGGPMTTLRNVRLLIETLEQVRDHGRPQLRDGAIRKRKDGQVVVEVFPRNGFDKLMYANFRAEVYMQPGVGESEVLDTMASIYRPGHKPEGKVALVLGAGNVSSIGPMDVLYKLFAENQVCILKMNPVNEYTGPYVERSFQPLVDGGYVRVVYGGADVGEHLVQHPDVAEIHITGSDRVHDIIVWGTGDEQAKNKQAGTPRMSKRITSELGCVTPVIIVPGEWSEAELDFQAANVATMVANNASFNCNAAKVVITWQGWPQRETFLNKIEQILGRVPLRKAYYPGSDKKYQEFVDAHPEAKKLAQANGDRIAWTTIFGVDAAKSDDIVFKREAWCGVLAETPVPAKDLKDFAKKAVDFCNDHVWGTLSCSLIVHPRTAAELGDQLEQMVADLRYGSVAVNHWAALSYGLVYTTWGAYPGHTLEDIQSGIGVVHNTLMFEKPQKSVIWGPFKVFPKPPWFSTHQNAHKVAAKLTKFEHNPSFWKFPGIAVSALRG